jgi:aryl-alcohol dehydrogenase-like predicted oxidoreductase
MVTPLGWGRVDDDDSVAAIHAAIDRGIRFFDTADTYGAGHSERVLGSALRDRRDSVVIATKWGAMFDESTRRALPSDASVARVRPALEGSLRRLGTDYVDLYQFHVDREPDGSTEEFVGELEQLVGEGLIRAYGWSTDDPLRPVPWAKAGAGFSAVQHDMSVLHEASTMLAVCEQFDLASVNRAPLAMGLLSGKYAAGASVADGDVRRTSGWLEWFSDGAPSPYHLRRVAALREALTSDGRSLIQGALGWLLALSERTIPIPGVRTPARARENAGVLARGPLSAEQMADVASVLQSLQTRAET